MFIFHRFQAAFLTYALFSLYIIKKYGECCAILIKILGEKECIEISMKDARRGIIWCKVRLWRLKLIRWGMERGTCPACKKEKQLCYNLVVKE